jgi:Ser/Thr protein kinase RdoA (MazF antagonist)
VLDTSAWPGLTLLERLAGGARSAVFRARRGREDLVVRRSGRPTDALDWELDLLGFLDGNGIRVPAVVPAGDGQRHVNGVLVQRWLPGGPPRTAADWAAVVATVQQVHALTRGWPQRPGFASSRQLVDQDRGGDVDLSAMPADAATLVRHAWEPAMVGAECAIHGDVGGNNLLVLEGRAALLDWDEARVDVPWFDFAHLPAQVTVSTPVHRTDLTTAGVAWEAATCWIAEPQYAARRLAELQRRLGAG